MLVVIWGIILLSLLVIFKNGYLSILNFYFIVNICWKKYVKSVS